MYFSGFADIENARYYNTTNCKAFSLRAICDIIIIIYYNAFYEYIQWHLVDGIRGSSWTGKTTI